MCFRHFFILNLYNLYYTPIHTTKYNMDNVSMNHIMFMDDYDKENGEIIEGVSPLTPASLPISLCNEDDVPIMDPAICALANIIRGKFRSKNMNEYVFRPVNIGGLISIPVIYKNPKIVNIEAQNVMVKRNFRSETLNEALSLCYEPYDDIEDALCIIKKINATYKLNPRCGEIQHPKKYTESVLEESVLPYDPDIVCSVCLETTTDVTVCNHGICLPCRDKCIATNNTKCPVCRSSALSDYKTLTHYYANSDYALVNRAYCNSLRINYNETEENM